MNKVNTIHAAILGASGYTGVELIRLLSQHPYINIDQLIAASSAGQPISAIYPHLNFTNLPDVIAVDEVDWSKLDVVFCCLPHATTQEIVKTIPDHIKIIDLSADFRLEDPELYKEWYHTDHIAKELQQEAVYGLTEVHKDAIKQARLVACPGCYPTSALLPLIPLLKEGAIKGDNIIIDSKSGMSGAGRTAKQPNLFCEMNDNVKAYGICNHRHMPEIEQELSKAAENKVSIHFTPHVIPMNRGLISTIYVQLTSGQSADSVRETLTSYYKTSPFVHITAKGVAPATKDVAGTNQARIGVFEGRTNKTAVLVCAIDNLIKGASGQAIQNVNVIYGWDELTGLDQVAVFP